MQRFSGRRREREKGEKENTGSACEFSQLVLAALVVTLPQEQLHYAEEGPRIFLFRRLCRCPAVQ